MLSQRMWRAASPILIVEAALALARHTEGMPSMKCQQRGDVPSPSSSFFFKTGFFGRHHSHISDSKASGKESYFGLMVFRAKN